MRDILLWLGIALGPVLAHAASTVPEQPLFRQVGVADGLPSNGGTALALDRDGFLWIGTRDGLARYDGVGYRIYRYAPGDDNGLPGNYISALWVGADNRVWVGIEGGGLSVLDAGRERFHHYRPETQPLMRSADVMAIVGDAAGNVWFGTFGGGLYRLDRQNRLHRFLPVADNPHSLPSENILALAMDGGGQLWVGTTDGLARWTARGFEKLATGSLSSEVIFSLSTAADGGLWIGTEQGLDRRWPDGRIERRVWQEQLPDKGVSSVVHDRQGDDWILTRKGMLRVHGKQAFRLDEGPAAVAQALAAQEDGEGGLWFATGKDGLLRLSPGWRSFSLLAATTGAQRGRARALAVGQDGELLLAGDAGSLQSMDLASAVAQPLFEPAAQADGFSAVFLASDATIWLGGRGLIARYERGARQPRYWRDDAAADAALPGLVYQFAQTPDGLLWLATYGSGLQARDSEGRVLHTVRPGDGSGIDSADQEQLAVGPDERLWLSNQQGLLRWNPGRRRFEPVPGAPRERIFAFAFLPPDTLWLHRMGALEAYRWNGQELRLIHSVNSDDGLPAVESGGMVADRSGTLWLTTTRGLLRYEPVGGRLRLFGQRDGLPSQEFDLRPPLMTPQGLGIASSAAGTMLFDPKRMRSDGRSPRLVLDSISLRRAEDQLSLPSDSHLVELAPDDRDLRVRARLLAFNDPGAHRYRFRLHGYDPDWVEVGAQGERVFSRLEPGGYRLEVIATDAEGQWSAPRGFELMVHAPWWRTAWAKASLAVAIVAGLWWFARRYRRRLRRRQDIALREQRQRLSERASEAKTRFLAMLGHEIRTPMTGVLGMSELLLAGELPPRQRQQVESIQRSGRHLLRLVNDALDLARIEAGKLSLQEEPFDLHAVLDECTALLQPLAEAKGLGFSQQRSPNTPRALRGDAGRLRQVLLNLGGNAIKFTERGEVAIRSEWSGGQLRLEVSDTGPGMSEEQQARLFQRFEQGEGAKTAARYGGSGLGLAICQELVAAMQGHIELQSQPLAGSTFRVLLPLPLLPVAELPAASADIDVIAVSSRRVLLVEDDSTVAEVVTGLLRGGGHTVCHAPHGLAALAELSTQTFDLAFLDLDLPGIDGFELARLIRSQGHRLPLVALTARADVQAEAQARQAGMTAFLRKPVLSRMLQETIESVCATSAAAGSARGTETVSPGSD
jgi:signal transduction histidine kinase/streptogramin lyase/ActR/RegA family two-component response regulator